LNTANSDTANTAAPIKTVILCGGAGTRLREETEFRPKTMVEIGSRPILWHIMKTYAHFDHRHFVLALGYRGNRIKEYFLNYDAMNHDFSICLGKQHRVVAHDDHDEQNYHVTLADTGLRTATGGRVRRLAKYLDNQTFMLTYGDGVADIDVDQLLAFHRSHGRLATVTTVKPMSRYGLLELGEDGKVIEFAEKPRVEGWASAGFFVFAPGVLDYLDGDACVLEQQPLQQLAAAGELVAYRHQGFFHTMDTYREYEALNRMWEDGQAPWKVWSP
jgi:glucose-1-phosphate cytidylyltransferase